MATNLDEMLAGVKQVPAELQRYFQLLRELDEQSEDLKQKVDKKIQSKLGELGEPSQPFPSGPGGETDSASLAKRGRGNAEDTTTSGVGGAEEEGAVAGAVAGGGGGGGGRRGGGARGFPAEVAQDVRKVLRLADEKVDLAQKILSFIHSHIEHLDKEIAALDDVAAQGQRGSAGAAPPPLSAPAAVGAGSSGAPGTAEPKPKKVHALEPGTEKKKKKKMKKGATTPAALLPSASAGNPPEPLPEEGPATLEYAGEEPSLDSTPYCYCQQPSDVDNMIGCDNEDCPHQWFHFACVGIEPGTKLPETWYCDTCKGAKEKKKKTKKGK